MAQGDRRILILELIGVTVGVFACIAGYLALVPEPVRWPWVVATPSAAEGAELERNIEPFVDEEEPEPTATPNPWAGIIDLESEGLAAIQGYELWFSSLAGNRWQIWHLNPQNGAVQKIQFDMPPEKQLLDQYVPSISPDGSKIAMAVGPCEARGHCARDLYLANIDGTGVRQLTNSECLDEFHPSWSPDGTKLTYFSGIWNSPRCNNVAHGIWVMDVESGATQQLTNQSDYDPVWSPNGRYIAYHSAVPSWDLKVLDYESCGSAVNSCPTWVVAEIGSLATSAGWINNNALVFTSDADGDWDIYRVPFAPNQLLNPTKLTDNDWDDQYPAVSTDGKVVIWQAFPYYDEGDSGPETGRAAVIHVLDLESGQEMPLITGIGNARDGFLRRTE